MVVDRRRGGVRRAACHPRDDLQRRRGRRRNRRLLATEDSSIKCWHGKVEPWGLGRTPTVVCVGTVRERAHRLATGLSPATDMKPDRWNSDDRAGDRARLRLLIKVDGEWCANSSNQPWLDADSKYLGDFSGRRSLPQGARSWRGSMTRTIPSAKPCGGSTASVV